MATTEEPEVTKIKLTAVGDAEIGKTCLLMSFSSDCTKSAPTIFQTLKFSKTIELQSMGQISIDFNLCDTSPEAEHASIRIKRYQNCDICFLCFNVEDLQSLQNIDTIWLPEVNEHAPNAVLVLVGLQCDRRDSNDNAIGPLQISEYQHKWKIPHYVECSVKRKLNTAKAFEIGIEQFLISEKVHRDSRGLSAISMGPGSLDDASPASLNTIVTRHQRQWTEHLFSMGFDPNDATLRARDNTNLSFPASNMETLSDVTASNLPQQSYSQQFALYSQAPSSFYQQFYPQQAYSMQLLPNLAEDQSTDTIQTNEAPPPPPPPAAAAIVPLSAPSVGTKKKKNDAFKEPLIKKKTASHVGCVDIDYQMQDDDEDEKPKKSACCVVL